MKDPVRIQIAGQLLQCSHCDSEVFFQHREAIQKADHLLFDRWSVTTVYVCSRCGCHQRFSRQNDPAETTPAEEVDERIVCLSCGAEMPSDVEKCQECGWSWESQEESTDS